MPFENRQEPVAPIDLWCRRVLRSIGLAGTIVSTSLCVGVLGYHILGQLSWVDSLLEASMILGGMGPVATMKTTAVKIFASFFALYSGLMLLSVMGIILAPWLHRMMHKFHVEDEKKKSAVKGGKSA